jgi:hypothetical protein
VGFRVGSGCSGWGSGFYRHPYNASLPAVISRHLTSCYSRKPIN